MTTTGNKLLDLLNTDVSKLLSAKENLELANSVKPLNQRVHRKSKRVHPPYGSSKLDGQLRTDHGMDVSIAIWDLSETGACLRATTNTAALLNTRKSLLVYNDRHTESLEVDVIVRWVDPISPNLFFTGILFDCDLDLIHGSFLSTYLS